MKKTNKTIIDMIATKALRNTLKNDGEHFYRHVTRWYSSAFSTPLKYVRENLLWPEILLEYFENMFYGLPKKKLAEYANSILDIEVIPEKKSEESFERMVEEIAQKTSKKKKPEKKPEIKEFEVKYDLDEDPL